MKNLLALGVTFVALLAAQSAQAQVYTWNQTSGAASWQTGTDWSPNGIPNGVGVQANVTSGLTAAETISLNGAVTLGTLDIGATSGNFGFTLAPGTGGSLTMNSGTGAGATINEASFNSLDQISSSISMADSNTTAALTINTADVSGKSFLISGGITSTGTGSNLVVNANSAGNMNISGLVNNQGTITSSGSSTGTVTLSGGVGSNVTGITISGAGSPLIVSGALATNASGTTLTSTASGTTAQMQITGGITGSGNLVIKSNGTENSSTGNAIYINTGNITTTGSITNSGTGTAVDIIANITATSGVLENGASSLLLGGNNSYSSNTTVQAGTLGINSANALGTGTLVISGGGIDQTGTTTGITVTNAQDWNGSFFWTGTKPLTFNTGAVTLGGNVTITAQTHGSSLTENGAISGTGNLIFNDNDANAAPSITLGGNVNNSGTITNSGTSTGITTISGNIGSSVGLISQSSTNSPLILSGTNTNVNGVALTAGTLKLGSTSALGATASTLTISGGTLDSTVANLDIANANAQNWNASFAFTGTNNLDLGTGAVTLGVTPTITTTAGTLTEDGAIGGGFGLTKAGAGTLALTGASTYSGVTTVTTGVLSFNSIGNVGAASSALGAPSTIVNGTISLGGGTLQYVGSSNGSSNRAINETTASTVDASGSATLALSGGINATNKGLTLQGSGLGTESGSLALGSGTLAKTGTGMWTLSGNDTYTGKTTVSQGTLEFANATSLYNSTTGSWTAANLTTSSGATLAFGVGGSGFTSTQVNTLNTNLVAGGTATTGFEAGSSIGLDTTGGNFVYNTAIGNNSVSGAVGVTKLGSNSLTLGGTNTYTGATNVNAGSLIVTGSTATGSAVNINSGGTLGGATAVNEGTLNGAVTLNSGGAVNLQDSTIGTMSVGSLTVNGGTLSFDVGAGSSGNLDLIASTGQLTLGGAATITIGFVSGTPTLTDGIYSLITYNGTTLTTAQFNNLSLSSTTLGSYTLQLINGAANSSTGGIELEITGGSGVTNGQYTLATTVTGSTLLHANGGTTTLSTTIKNSGTTGQDTLGYSSLTATAGSGTVTTPGSNPSGSALALGATSTANVETYTAGATAGSVAIGNSATVNNTTASGTPVNTPTNTGTSVYVYSGQSTWAGTGASGVWGTSPTDGNFGVNWGNYQATGYQGSPGVTTGFTGVDTATFGNVSGHSAVQVNLAGANPDLNAITFNAPSTSYTIGGGSDTGAITLSQGTSAPLPTISVPASGGSHTIAAPVVLGSATSLVVASGQQLTLSGQISGGNSLSNTGAGTTILSNPTGNTYSGGTAISAGIVYVNNTSGSGTGTGNVTVGSGDTANSGTLAGSGNIGNTTTRTTVTVSGGGTIYSGAKQTSAPTVTPGSGLTFTNTTVNVSGDAPATLAFALGTDTTSAYATSNGATYNFASPSLNSTYITLASGSTLNFAGVDSISIVDETTAATLTLRQGNPYLLVTAAAGDSAYTGLITVSGTGPSTTYSIDGNGYVLGVLTSAGVSADLTTGLLSSLSSSYYTPISINQFGADGVTPLGTGAYASDPVYAAPALYLYNGDLEVVPEPGTWALMLGGLVVLLVIQRRRLS